MGPPTLPDVVRGRAALAAGDVASAREAFAAACTVEASGEALSGLAEATYRALDFPSARTLYGHAVSAYQREGRFADAARVCRTLAYQYVLHGDLVVTAGWVERARRLVAADGERRIGGTDGTAHAVAADAAAVERRWVELFDALADSDPGSRDRRLWSLLDSGPADPALECDVKALIGKQYVEDGRVAEGIALLEDALAAVEAGEVADFVVMEGAFCLMLGACEVTQDVERATRWTGVADRIGRERGLASLRPLCRGYWGGLLVVAGRWEEAEDALAETVRRLELGYTAARDGALVRLAGLRLRQGQLEAAAELLHGLEEHPEAALTHARLLLDRGELARAQDRVEHALGTAHGSARAHLLAVSVDIHLAHGDLPGAAGDVARLEQAARDQASPPLQALAARAAGRVCLARGNGDAAGCLRRAMTAFAQARMPLELALTRLELAAAVATCAPDVAVAEASLAREALDLLPAPRQSDAAAALLRRLGVPSRPGPRGGARLTARERVVLDLLGHGLSNPEIADRLCISRKTVEHHVSRVLSKLGLRNRAEAAAYAVRVAPGS